jgi:hypothetical protein
MEVIKKDKEEYEKVVIVSLSFVLLLESFFV